jgi:hypothetical protein
MDIPSHKGGYVLLALQALVGREIQMESGVPGDQGGDGKVSDWEVVTGRTTVRFYGISKNFCV